MTWSCDQTDEEEKGRISERVIIMRNRKKDENRKEGR